MSRNRKYGITNLVEEIAKQALPGYHLVGLSRQSASLVDEIWIHMRRDTKYGRAKLDVRLFAEDVHRLVFNTELLCAYVTDAIRAVHRGDSAS